MGESPDFYRWSQTPDERIGTQSAKCATEEVVDDSNISGNIEGIQTDVRADFTISLNIALHVVAVSDVIKVYFLFSLKTSV